MPSVVVIALSESFSVLGTFTATFASTVFSKYKSTLAVTNDGL